VLRCPATLSDQAKSTEAHQKLAVIAVLAFGPGKAQYCSLRLPPRMRIENWESRIGQMNSSITQFQFPILIRGEA
jgi:hypothetical protein